jgi:hypothetical protein
MRKHHCLPIDKGFVKVSIVKSIVHNASLPKKEGPCTRVGEGVGMFFVWPRWLVIDENSSATPQRITSPSEIKPTEAKNIPRYANEKTRMQFLKELPSFVRVLYDLLFSHDINSTYHFFGNESVFGERRDFIVPFRDFQDLWNMGQLPCTMLSLHQM